MKLKRGMGSRRRHGSKISRYVTRWEIKEEVRRMRSAQKVRLRKQHGL